MALVKCPKCGREGVSDTATSCPGCGYNIKEHLENEAKKEIKNEMEERKSIKCPECGTEIDEKSENCPNCGFEIINDNTKSAENSDVEKVSRTGMNKKKIFSITAIIVIIALIAGVGIYQKNKAEQIKKRNIRIEAEQNKIKKYNQYVDDLNDLYDYSLTGAGYAEDVCVLTLNVWHDSIWNTPSDETSKYVSGASDFNEALDNLYADEETTEKIENVNTYKGYIDDIMIALQTVPEGYGLENAYSAAVDVNTAVQALAQMAISPTGNYNTFSQSEKEKVDEFLSARSTFQALIPAKKEVPLYDEDGKKVADSLDFIISLHQMTNKLPATTTCDNEALGHYVDTATVYGIDGNLSFLTGNDVVSSIIWSTDKTDKTTQDKIYNGLMKRYGDPSLDKENTKMWDTSEDPDGVTVSFSVKEDGIQVMWF